jgi:hypothetical protein
MISGHEIAMRAASVAALLASIAAVWALGVALAKLRGRRPDNVVWYENDLFGIALLFVPFGIAAMAARLRHVPGWDTDVVWWLVGFCFAAFVMMTLIVFRYRLEILPVGIVEPRVFGIGNRCIAWGDILNWKLGRKQSSVILTLNPRGKFEFAPAFKDGSDLFYEAVEAHQIPEA